MNRLLLRFAMALAGALLIAAAVGGAGPRAEASPPGMVKVLIAFDRLPGPAEQAIVRGAGATIHYTYHLVPAIAASVPSAAIDGLRRNPRVASVEPDIEVHAVNAELDNSWGVKRIGSGTVHSSGNLGAGIKVAIIDSGIDYTHPELAASYKGGWDFVNKDNDPMDDNGHGTHVAGTVAASYNDGGVVGVAPGAHAYGLKVLGTSGSGSFSDVIAALQWSVDNGIRVTNNSYGSSSDPGTIVKNAFDNAYAAGVLHVAAAGNSGTPPGKGDNVIYPAKYASVIAVAATNSSDARANFSSTGPAVELAAPGVGINSTVPGGGYESWSGTSMASPHVAGAAALIMASGVNSAAEVRSVLQNSADDLGASGRDPHFGFGLVNAARAVGTSVPPSNSAPSVSWTNPTGGTVSGTVAIQINASDAEDSAGTLAVEWQVNGGTWQTTTFSSGSGRYESSWDTTTASDGGYTLTARATDSGGLAATATASVTVRNSPAVVVTVDSITPNYMAAGSTVGVTIGGSGFQTGASVSFENGSAFAPTASGVVVVDAGTLTATLSVKSGGAPGSRVWDVRVTNSDGSSGVLQGGFTVTR